MARIAFVLLLTGFAVAEHYFQALGFIRTPRRSAFSLFVFSAFVLWLVHRTALFHVTAGRASERSPARARIALYGATLMFVLFPIHARGALHDVRITNEIFLYLFFGALNFGLPYYLYLYASQRFGATRLTAASALGWVSLGAAVTVLLTLSDKLALADWSLRTAWDATEVQLRALLEGRHVGPAAFLPAVWTIWRGAVVIGALATVGFVVRRRVRDPQLAHAAPVYALMGVAAGLACFSNRGLELPLVPQRATYLVAPLHTSAWVDASFMIMQASILLPALMLGMALGSRRRWRRAAWGAGAFGTHIALTLLWPAHEPWLRSSGLLFSVAAIVLIALGALAVALRDSLSDGDTQAADAARLLTPRELRLATIGLAMLLGAVVVRRIAASATSDYAIASGVNGLPLPQAWIATESDRTDRTLTLTHDSWSGTPATLRATLLRTVLDSSDASLLRVATAGVSAGEIEPLTFERWDRFSAGAFALDFRIKASLADGGGPALGTAAVARLPNGDALLVATLYASTDVARRWDVARALQRLSR